MSDDIGHIGDQQATFIMTSHGGKSCDCLASYAVQTLSNMLDSRSAACERLHWLARVDSFGNVGHVRDVEQQNLNECACSFLAFPAGSTCARCRRTCWPMLYVVSSGPLTCMCFVMLSNTSSNVKAPLEPRHRATRSVVIFTLFVGR